MKLLWRVKPPLEYRAAEIVLLQFLLLLEAPVGLERRGNLLAMNKHPRVHALHAGLQGLPLSAFDRLEDERVFCYEERRGFGERVSEVLELLDGEALVLDAGEEVAVLEVVFDGLDGLLLLGAADGGDDWRWAAVEDAEVGGGGGFEGERGGEGEEGSVHGAG